MKNLIAALALVLFASGQALAVDKQELEQKIQKHIGKFLAMQEKADKAIPADVLKKARGIVLLDRTKAGFIFAYQGGSGVAMVKDKNDNWSPIAFLKANEASLGFQVGGQQSFLVMVLMNEDATRMLTEPKFDFGGEARGTAGDASAGAEGNVASKEIPVLIYDDRAGLFGGAALKGGALSPDSDANLAYYGEAVTVKEILFEKKVKPSASAEKLAQKINEAAKGK
jgi:lipid-binding SYLF domain-containing protein